MISCFKMIPRKANGRIRKGTRNMKKRMRFVMRKALAEMGYESRVVMVTDGEDWYIKQYKGVF